MVRACWALSLGWLLAMSSGCAMCASPFDYCYPAFGGTQEQPPPCGPRAGSIFASGGMVTGYEGEEIVTPSPTPAAPQMAPPPMMSPQMTAPPMSSRLAPRQISTPSRMRQAPY